MSRDGCATLPFLEHISLFLTKSSPVLRCQWLRVCREVSVTWRPVENNADASSHNSSLACRVIPVGAPYLC